MNPTPPNRYAPLVDIANQAANANTVPLRVEIPLVQAAQLSRLALHLNKSPAEIVADAIAAFLAARHVGRP